MAKSKYSEEVIETMVEALGGDEKVQELVNSKRLHAILRPNQSISVTIDQANEEGWLDWLRALTWGEITDILSQKEGPSRSAGLRMTNQEVADLRTMILGFLNTQSNKKASDIAKAIKYPTRTVSTQLKHLIKMKQVARSGKKAQTTYSLK